MSYQQLKDRQRAERHAWPENLGLRVHRALSWLHRAEQLQGNDDVDGQFILLWIAFNAAYATDIDEKYRESEQQTFRAFVEKLDTLDAGHKRFEHLMWVNVPDRSAETECLGAARERRGIDVPAGPQRCRDSKASRSFRRVSGCCSTTSSCLRVSGRLAPAD